MKFRRFFIALALLAGAAMTSPISPARAGVLLGNGTFNVANDLTRIQVGGTVLEFLDLTATNGASVTAALTSFAGAGFTWATGAQVAELFSAFGITYAAAANALTDLGASLASRTDFVSYLGVTGGTDASLGWIDDLTSATFHTYSCISLSRCGGLSYTYNSSSFWPQDGQIGVFLVREDATTVPEPASLALLGVGLAGLTLARRRRDG